jgi:hypothetical protein
MTSGVVFKPLPEVFILYMERAAGFEPELLLHLLLYVGLGYVYHTEYWENTTFKIIILKKQ